METRLIMVLTLAAALAPANLSAQNLVRNGSFEVNYGFSDWIFTGTLLNLGGPGAGVQCADGYNAVGLSWQTGLYQDVATIPGQRYNLSFYMADWGPNYVPANTVTLTLSFDSNFSVNTYFNGAGHTYQNMGWRQFAYTVTATTASSTILFYNPGPYGSDTRWPMIDNVSLTPVPEPPAIAVLCLFGFMALYRQCRTKSAASKPAP